MADSSSIVTGAAIAVISGALAPLIKDWVISWLQRARDARYLAIRVLSVLENFIQTCSAIYGDNGEDDEEGISHEIVRAPATFDLPEDIEWKSIEQNLMYRILSLPNQVVAANKWINAAAQNDGPPDFNLTNTERQYQYGRLGLIAIGIVSNLRYQYKLPEPEILDRYATSHLESCRKKIEFEEEERRKDREQWWA